MERVHHDGKPRRLPRLPLGGRRLDEAHLLACRRHGLLDTTTSDGVLYTRADATAPALPAAIALVNGGGPGSQYLNLANVSSLSVSVTLPATSQASDLVEVRVAGGAQSVAKTAPAAAGREPSPSPNRRLLPRGRHGHDLGHGGRRSRQRLGRKDDDGADGHPRSGAPAAPTRSTSPTPGAAPGNR